MVDGADKTILIVFASTVEIVTEAVPKSTPLPVMVTDSVDAFESDIPVNRTACGIFQLAAVKFRVAGESVIAAGLLEVRFRVLAAPGFPERLTESKAVPPSVTVVTPLKTGCASFSVVAIVKDALGTAGAEAVIVTLSLV